MFFDCVHQFANALVLTGDCTHNLGPPFIFSLVKVKHHFDFQVQAFHAFPISLVNGKNIAYLQDASLDGLNIISKSRNQYYQCGVGSFYDIYFRLSHADCFNNDNIFACRVKNLDDFGSFTGHSAETATGCHATDKHTIIHCQFVHPDAIAQDGAAGKRATGIHRDNADGFTPAAVFFGQLVGQSAFAGPGRSGNTNDISMSRMGIKCLHDFCSMLIFVFYGCNSSRYGQLGTVQQLCNDIHKSTT